MHEVERRVSSNSEVCPSELQENVSLLLIVVSG